MLPFIMTKEEVAYLAGLFDGEGCVNIVPYRSSKNGILYNRVLLRITNTYKPVLEWVRSILGYGHISVDRRSERNTRKKDCYRYCVTNKNAIKTLKLIQPYLMIKSDHVSDLLTRKINGRHDS